MFFMLQNTHIYNVNVYKETLEVLEKLKDKYRLGIYSEGTKKFQNHKFKSLGLNKYFDKDLIFIVDDKETICEFLTKNEIRAIWLNRKDNRKSDKCETIYSLFELPVIL